MNRRHLNTAYKNWVKSDSKVGHDFGKVGES